MNDIVMDLFSRFIKEIDEVMSMNGARRVTSRVLLTATRLVFGGELAK
jgi:hypothetical protein